MMNSVKLRILISNTTNPWFNLATEDWIFQDLDDFDQILFLWRNAETVVIGRSQNPWAECHLEKMQQDGILLARRQSGGGAVFHDLGNTNFTFLAKKHNYDPRHNFDIITSALKRLGIMSQTSGRNDMVVQLNSQETKKFSGSAFRAKKDRAFHHGTLLLNANLEKLTNYLNPNKKKLISKGVESVRSRVINLSELQPHLTHEILCETLIQEFQNFHQASCEIEYLQPDYLQKQERLNQHYDLLQSWEWLYGQTMEFTHHFEERFSWGSIEIQLDVQNGIINDNRIYSDSLYPNLIDAISRQLKNIRYDKTEIMNSLTPIPSESSLEQQILSDCRNWLNKEIS